MFQKLRNRFLLLNLFIISVMMLIAFASIYLITYQNVNSEIRMDLRRISEFNRRIDRNSGLSVPDSSEFRPIPKDSAKVPPGSSEKSGTIVDNQKPITDMESPLHNFIPANERTISFFITTDPQWNIQSKFSFFETEDAFYESAAIAVSSKNKETGKFKLDGDYWAYQVKPLSGGYRIAFLNISSQQAILSSLVYTFLLVALVMLVLIYWISRFFANKSIKPVKEAFDKQRQFIADASHELKTPLAVINTNIDALLSNGEESIHKQSKWLHYIKSESERMSKLTNDLLYLTQVDYSDMKLIFTDFNLSEAVENVILTMEAVIFEHHLSLNYDVEPGLIINGNIEEVREVVLILLDNALKYASENGSIQLSLKKRHNDVVLSVTNTGEGISEEHLGKIFDRFYRTDKSRSRQLGGYGLGLAIAKAIIEQHKGKIYAKSVINDKTTFFVELPVSNP